MVNLVYCKQGGLFPRLRAWAAVGWVLLPLGM